MKDVYNAVALLLTCSMPWTILEHVTEDLTTATKPVIGIFLLDHARLQGTDAGECVISSPPVVSHEFSLLYLHWYTASVIQSLYLVTYKY